MKQISNIISELYMIYHHSSYQWSIRFVFEGLATQTFKFEELSTLLSVDLINDKPVESVSCDTYSRVCTIYL